MFRSVAGWWSRCLFIGLLAVPAGCDSGRLKTVPVTGTVLWKGNPIEGVTVVFSRGQSSINDGEIAIGKTDAAGKFELTTHFGPQASAPGAVVGNYKVTISKQIPPPNIDPEKYKAMVEAANKIAETGSTVPPNKQPPPLVELFPAAFSGNAATKLTANVTPGGPNVFEFKAE
ncbi:carboxypeptidase-like regulatory domain-containing protein [Zavarzinella formosa]|uniref:carboxypeptidase-like regulatory domain-containing protein n=1 Tax=Zavarzinella formosa TaxID=360055 RepID=UPI0002FCD871|nr:carboxypeptidase-like regulatory domain-containing protein [Zavarzinella formosa]